MSDPYCGDSTCDPDEDCNTCPDDCGFCEDSPTCGPGDANCDGLVDLSDLIMVGVDYSKTSDFKPGADLDKDEIVDLGDLVLIGLNYGKSY